MSSSVIVLSERRSWGESKIPICVEYTGVDWQL